MNITVPIDIITVLLFIPIIATIVNISRYIIGIKTFGLYPTLVLTFAFLLTGAKYGLIITTVAVIATLLIHRLVRRIKMHYISRTAISYTLVCTVLIIFFSLIKLLPIDNQFFIVDNINPISLVLIISLSDYIIKEYINRNVFTALRSIGETVIIAMAGWAILRTPNLSQWLHKYFWFIGIIAIVNFTIGQSANFKLLDYLRFKDILLKDENPDTETTK